MQRALSRIIMADPVERGSAIDRLVSTPDQWVVIDALGRMSAADLCAAIRATIPAADLIDAPDLIGTADACSAGRGPVDTLRRMLAAPMDRAYVIWIWSLRRPLAPQTVARERLVAEGKEGHAQRIGLSETLFPEFDTEFHDDDEDCDDLDSGSWGDA